jgi:hypothetical protein
LDKQLARLTALEKTELAAFNQEIGKKKLDPVAAK